MNLKLLFSGLVFVLSVVLLLVAQQAWKIYLATGKTSYNAKPFVRNNPNAKLKILFIGDSTAVGTGAAHNTESVAGWFGQDFPQAQIENFSANGRRIAEQVQLFHSTEEHYDLIVAQIGGNDIMKFTPYSQIEKNLAILVKWAKQHAEHVIILHSGNVGLAPVFIWPFDEILTDRSRVVRAMYMKKAAEEGVFYVDLFTERENDMFLRDISQYYSPDHLHPSGQGYRWWYDMIRKTLDKGGVKL